MRRLAAIAALLGALAAGTTVSVRATGDQPVAMQPPPPRATEPAPGPIQWRRSRAAGQPWRGRLVRGVLLPSEGRHFFTWDPILRRSPNREWRRWGTDRLIRTLLRVVHRYRAANPEAPRVAIGDLSRPRGGDFGPRFGSIGHASHQNGLDADIYYPRVDRRERRPRSVDQIDRELAQAMVDELVRARAAKVFVGPRTGLTGPHRRVLRLAHHDDHLHVRIRARRSGL